jgi:hypothetical protein
MRAILFAYETIVNCCVQITPSMRKVTLILISVLTISVNKLEDCFEITSSSWFNSQELFLCESDTYGTYLWNETF